LPNIIQLENTKENLKFQPKVKQKVIGAFGNLFLFADQKLK